MTEQLNHETFDLIAVLSGRDYPTVEVPVYFHEGLGLKAYKIQQELKRATGDKLEELDAEYAKLQEEAASERYVVTLKAVDESLRRDVFNAVAEEFPSTKDMLGRETPHPKSDDEFTKRMWAIYIEKVTSPSGAISLTTPDIVNALYAKAPASFHAAVNEGIAELQVGTRAGFEQMAKDTDFLSDASPEG